MGKAKFSTLSVIIDNEKSWMWTYVPRLRRILEEYSQKVRICKKVEEIWTGDILFILSCDRILGRNILSLNKHNIVVHASDLPAGRGWSPWTHQVEAGANEIPLTLFEAAPDVDSGDYYLKDRIPLKGDELVEDLRALIGEKVVDMISAYLAKFPLPAIPQTGMPTYFPRRTENDCQLDVDKSIREQFNKLRVLDNELYPAFFYHSGCKYILKIEKA
ncbi:MAG: formyltransferase family protein [Desulfovibrionaceae bacterium]